MSDDEQQGLGDLFAADSVEEPTYPIEELSVDRRLLAEEGVTNVGFSPLLDRFDHTTPQSRGVDLAPLRVFFRNKRHSLWGHKLWNAAKYVVKRMDSQMIDVRGKTVLELGAGLGVPALAAFKNGARCVVVTDYPDAELLDIIAMNVTENCAENDMDSDARAFLLDEARRWRPSHRGGSEDELTEAQVRQVTHTRCVVEPLLWGKEAHIKHVLSYTGGSGFDVVILSDILFNHVCNDDLADTVARVLLRGQHAAAYCVFSHHRAHKQVEDLEFFDKCVARGLCYEQIDEEDYSLMFPDDRGPEEIRKPVKAYKITHRLDDAGVGLEVEPDGFDVVLQGTGMVESMLSAALARSGLRVLHCDGQADYGGPFKTLTITQLREYMESMRTNDVTSMATTKDNETGDFNHKDKAAYHFTHEGESKALVEVDRMDELNEREQRRFLVDLLPTHYLSNGDTIRQLIQSDMARHLEFQNLAQFLFLLPDTSHEKINTNQTRDDNDNESHPSCSDNANLCNRFRIQSVPLSRSRVFTASHIGLLQKRRLMKFVKDVEPAVAEQLHARGADMGDDPHAEAALARAAEAEAKANALFAAEARSHPNETLSAMMERRYGVSGDALDAVTLMRQLDDDPKKNGMEGLTRGVRLVRQILTSVGAFGGVTPFLLPVYGTGEMPQNMCRIAAVWNGTFVLRRSLRRVTCDSTGKSFAVLSNGQHVRTKAVVVPEVLKAAFLDASKQHRTPTPRHTDAEEKEKYVEKDENEVRFARVVLIARQPLFSWSTLRQLQAMEEGSPREEEKDAFPPLTLALCRPCAGVVVHIQQVSASSEQAPLDSVSVVVHFTVNEREMGVAELHQFVRQAFVTHGSPDTKAETMQGNNMALEESAVLFFASFVVREKTEACSGVIRAMNGERSETHKAHPYALEEYHRRQETQHGGGNPIEESELERLFVSVPTLFQNLFDDGAYVEAARRGYEAVLTKLDLKDKDGKPYTFLERLPPAPGQRDE